MEPRISLVTLGVSDLDASIRFYRDGLGLPMLDREPDEQVAFFTLEGTWLGLFPRHLLAEDAGVADTASGGFGGVTLAQNVASREAVDALLAEAGDAGATLAQPARETDWGGYSGYFADPDDHLWEVAWNPHFTIE